MFFLRWTYISLSHTPIRTTTEKFVDTSRKVDSEDLQFVDEVNHLFL